MSNIGVLNQEEETHSGKHQIFQNIYFNKADRFQQFIVLIFNPGNIKKRRFQ